MFREEICGCCLRGVQVCRQQRDGRTRHTGATVVSAMAWQLPGELVQTRQRRGGTRNKKNKEEEEEEEEEQKR